MRGKNKIRCQSSSFTKSSPTAPPPNCLLSRYDPLDTQNTDLYPHPQLICSPHKPHLEGGFEASARNTLTPTTGHFETPASRISSNIPQDYLADFLRQPSRWLAQSGRGYPHGYVKGNHICGGRARRYGTVASTTSDGSTGHAKSRGSSPSEAGSTYSIPRPWSEALRPETAASKPSSSSTPKFYVPSVLLPPEAAKSPSVHKIHILGDDERSRFIAHALSGVYDSVEMLGWKRSSSSTSPPSFSSKYRNIYKSRHGDQRKMKLEHVSVTPKAISRDDRSHIDQLLVAGPGHEAVEALQSVKHRINKDTAVCLMTDGLGVLEEVRARVFQGTEATPSFLLGHMSHRLAFNRRYDSVRELRHGKTQLTFADSSRLAHEVEKTETRMNFVQTLRGVKDLNSSLTPFDKWLHFKLPSVILDSVIEPVCVLLEIPYGGLLRNPAAQRMMHRLLTEVVSVVDNMPEVEGSAAIRDFIRGNRIRQLVYSRIMARRGASSELARQIQHGLPTDIDYLNGFFIRRGRQLGLDLPTNVMMRDMVKAKHSLAIEKLNSYVPVEETSVPSHLSFRYRTLPTSKHQVS
ncbi:2-dehydropantoate 2-reductase [Trichoderma arundinaceum]|uniref:2-dehydropantoate 2-reductase n=1 Tax=Trichoderma arundinaceum TaxID=490622 RepID=A0A395NN97_TRIAR|nr:2-dehydropantoate 2-reductase [Trichoderma arundinaceum]